MYYMSPDHQAARAAAKPGAIVYIAPTNGRRATVSGYRMVPAAWVTR